jgi:hypothetical protein
VLGDLEVTYHRTSINQGECAMNSRPLRFSSVTGLLLAASGAGVAASGIAGWGLFTVGLGILGISLLTLSGARSQALVSAHDGDAGRGQASAN